MENHVLLMQDLFLIIYMACAFTKSGMHCFRLYVPPNSVSRNIPNNLQMWLWQDMDNNDSEFQLMRGKLIQELDEIEQGTTSHKCYSFFNPFTSRNACKVCCETDLFHEQCIRGYVHTSYLTNSREMTQKPIVLSYSGNSLLFVEPEVHYHVHKSLLLVPGPELDECIPLSYPVSLRFILIL
jgi:hypothetical protein